MLRAYDAYEASYQPQRAEKETWAPTIFFLYLDTSQNFLWCYSNTVVLLWPSSGSREFHRTWLRGRHWLWATAHATLINTLVWRYNTLPTERRANDLLLFILVLWLHILLWIRKQNALSCLLIHPEHRDYFLNCSCTVLYFNSVSSTNTRCKNLGIYKEICPLDLGELNVKAGFTTVI